MRSASLFVSLLAGAAYALPQGIDIAVINEADAPAVTGPEVTASVEVPTAVYDAEAVQSSVAAAVLEDDSTVSRRRRRQIDVNAPCAPQPDGFGPRVSPDTDSQFLRDATLNQMSLSAKSTPPTGYTTSFSGLTGSVSLSTYMGLYTLNKYDPALCASYCDQATGCLGINLYFERDPSVNPADACPNPASMTNIKCTLWGSQVTAASANNEGQWRGPGDAQGQAFHVVIAGSNGYSKPTPPPTQPGYNPPAALPGACDATYNGANGKSVFIKSQFFRQQFDAGVCATLCSATTKDNKKNSNGKPFQACNFFNAFIVSVDDKADGIYCSMYTEVIPSKYATARSVSDKGKQYSVSYSYGFASTVQDSGNA